MKTWLRRKVVQFTFGCGRYQDCCCITSHIDFLKITQFYSHVQSFACQRHNWLQHMVHLALSVWCLCVRERHEKLIPLVKWNCRIWQIVLVQLKHLKHLTFFLKTYQKYELSSLFFSDHENPCADPISTNLLKFWFSSVKQHVHLSSHILQVPLGVPMVFPGQKGCIRTVFLFFFQPLPLSPSHNKAQRIVL